MEAITSTVHYGAGAGADSQWKRGGSIVCPSQGSRSKVTTSRARASNRVISMTLARQSMGQSTTPLTQLQISLTPSLKHDTVLTLSPFFFRCLFIHSFPLYSYLYCTPLSLCELGSFLAPSIALGQSKLFTEGVPLGEFLLPHD